MSLMLAGSATRSAFEELSTGGSDMCASLREDAKGVVRQMLGHEVSSDIIDFIRIPTRHFLSPQRSTEKRDVWAGG